MTINAVKDTGYKRDGPYLKAVEKEAVYMDNDKIR